MCTNIRQQFQGVFVKMFKNYYNLATPHELLNASTFKWDNIFHIRTCDLFSRIFFSQIVKKHSTKFFSKVDIFT